MRLLTAAALILGLWAPRPASSELSAADLRALVLVLDRASEQAVMVDGRTDELLGRLALGHRSSTIAIARDRGWLLSADPVAQSIHLFDLASGMPVAEIPVGHDVWHFRLAPDESMIAVVDYEGGGVSLVDLEPPFVGRYVGGLSSPHNVEFEAGMERLLVTQLDRGVIGAIDLETGEIGPPIDPKTDLEGWSALTLTPGGDRAVLTGVGEDAVTILDLVKGTPLARLPSSDLVSPAYPTAAGDEMIILDQNAVEILLLGMKGDPAASQPTRIDGLPDMSAAVVAWFDSIALVTSATFPGAMIVDLDDPTRTVLLDLPAPGGQATSVLDGAKIYVPIPETGQLAVVDARMREVTTILDDMGQEPWLAYTAGAPTFCH